MLTSFEILGNSAGIPTVERGVSSVIVSTGKFDLMLDCGEGTYLRWKKAGYRWRRLKAILITHMHPDHVCGLVPLLFYRKLLNIESELFVYGPPELASYIKDSFSYTGVTIGYDLMVIPVADEYETDFMEDLKLKSRKLEHRVACYGYRLEDEKGKIFTFMTDTKPCTAGESLLRNSDVLIHEATFEDKDKDLAEKAFHTTIHQAFGLADSGNVKRLYLTHFSPRIETSRLRQYTYNNYPILPDGKEKIS